MRRSPARIDGNDLAISSHHRVDPIDDAVLRANRNKAKELAKSADGDSIVRH